MQRRQKHRQGPLGDAKGPVKHVSSTLFKRKTKTKNKTKKSAEKLRASLQLFFMITVTALKRDGRTDGQTDRKTGRGRAAWGVGVAGVLSKSNLSPEFEYNTQNSVRDMKEPTRRASALQNGERWFTFTS